MSKIVGDSACPSCRAKGRDKTGNHLIHFDNGNKFCNRCGYKEGNHTVNEEEVYSNVNIKDVEKFPCIAISPRGLLTDPSGHFNVHTSMSEENGQPENVYFPVYSKKGEIVGWKCRSYEGKNFLPSVGTWKGVEIMLFGQQQCPKGGKKLLITEGEYDAMAAWQMLKERYPQFEPNVVSIPNGASAAEKDIANNLDFLQGFEEIIIAFDADEAGMKASAAVATLIGTKARIMKW